MSPTYAQTQKTAQKKEVSTAAAVLDASSQGESLQRKADMTNNAAQREEAPRPNNTGMPDNLKSGIESLSGFSMDNVRVHYNSSKPATVQALAYTQGTDIHVAPGQEKHLPHEAWHVAQQMAGRVSPTTNINGMPVNDNAALEHEADVMGEKALQCMKMGDKSYSKYTPSYRVAQCYKYNNITFNKFGELRKWIRRRFFCPSTLKELKKSFNMEETLCDNFDISDLETIDEIINILPSKRERQNFPFFNNCPSPLSVEEPDYESKYNLYRQIYARIFKLKDNVDCNNKSVKKTFFTTTNINKIIIKLFSSTLDSNMGLGYILDNDLDMIVFDNIFLTISQGIQETIKDINYWFPKDDIKEIDLTDSDVHYRGIGVCIVTDENGSKHVIKPGDKSLERVIYGKRKKHRSLADVFGGIENLGIRTKAGKGSLVEYFDHDKLKDIPYPAYEISEISLFDLMRFISILGLRDLHIENLVYSKRFSEVFCLWHSRRPQLIDAEIALDFRSASDSDPFHYLTEAVGGFRSIPKDLQNQWTEEEISEEEFRRCIKLLNEAKKKLKGKISRIVLIATSVLYTYRSYAYAEKNYQSFEKYAKALFESLKDGLEDRLGERFNETHLIDSDIWGNNIYNVLKSGKIPYFEYSYDDGKISQKDSESDSIDIYNSAHLKLENVIERRKKILEIAFLKQQHSETREENVMERVNIKRKIIDLQQLMHKRDFNLSASEQFDSLSQRIPYLQEHEDSSQNSQSEDDSIDEWT